MRMLSQGAIACVAMTLLLATAQAQQGSARLRVMTFNIEYGGTHVSFEKVVEVIRRSGADIVGIQEAEGNLERLASELGWHFDLQNYAISRFPLLNPGAAQGRYVLVEVQPGKVVALLNVHLPSDPYGPDLVRDGASPDEVLALERSLRTPKIRPYLDAAKELVTLEIPVFLTGDFNTPAHTDWSKDAVGTRPFLRYPIAWPVTLAASKAGLHDAWRVTHTDPLVHPGLTWWAARPPRSIYSFDENDAQDRIDFIWYGGPVEVLGSGLIGEVGTPEAVITVEPWPSDHRAVIADFNVEAADTPPLLAMDRRVVTRGDNATVMYRNVAPARLQVRQDGAGKSTRFTVNERIAGDGAAGIDARLLSSGHYRVRLQQAANKELTTEFWVLEQGAKPWVGLVHDSKGGEDLLVSWRDAPGLRNDYLAIVREGTKATYDGPGTWIYVNAMPAGSLRIGKDNVAGEWPLAPGRYVVRLMKDDGIEVLAESAPFDIV